MTAVLFDLDDTLFDHRRTSQRALARLRVEQPVLQRFSLDELEARHARVLEVLHRNGVMQGRVAVDEARRERFRRLWRAAGVEPTDDEVRRAAAMYRDAYVDEGCLVPGAEVLLRLLAPEVRLGIVSNNLLAEQEEKLRRFGLRPLFEVVVASAEEGVAKPEPEIFRRAIARLGVAASEAVMVGDSWATDVVGSTAVGLRAVWLNRYGEAAPDPTLATEIVALEPAPAVAAILLRGGTSASVM